MEKCFKCISIPRIKIYNFYTTYLQSLMRFVCILAFAIPSAVHAYDLQQKCVDATICTGPEGKDCSVKTYCNWVMVGSNNSGPPPGWTPTPPAPNVNTGSGSVGGGSAPTPADIEKEVHKKFCKEFPAKIASAVGQCQGSAMGYNSYFIQAHCSDVKSATWDFKILLKDMVNVGYSQEVTPGPTCVANANNARDATMKSCEVSGNIYRVALASQCSDVP